MRKIKLLLVYIKLFVFPLLILSSCAGGIFASLNSQKRYSENNFKYVRSKEDLDKALEKIIYEGGPPFRVLDIVRMGANPDMILKNGDTPLIYVVKKNDFYLTRALIKSGAKIDLCDKDNKNALSYAVANENIPIVKILSEKKFIKCQDQN